MLTLLEDLSARVSAMAERLNGTDRDTVANELFEVERALRQAETRLAKTVDTLS
jgi:hypothetical protein